jgi:hypothetical protein
MNEVVQDCPAILQIKKTKLASQSLRLGDELIYLVETEVRQVLGGIDDLLK